MTEREQGITALYESIANRALLSRDDYAVLLQDWGFDLTPIRDGDEVIGAALSKGPEVHLGVKRRPRGAHRELVRALLVRTIEQHGRAVTTVLTDNPAGLAFCQRLGFYITHQTEEIIHLTCERACHA